MAARLHHPLRGLKNLTKPNRPPNLNQKRTFAFSLPLPPPPPPAAAARPRAPSLPLSALRSLAQHLVSSSKRLFSTQPVTGAAPLKHTHLPSDLASRIRVGRGTMPGFGGFHSSSAGRFGPGGLGRGPMGPGVRGGFSRGVGNVGLGTARGYASMARPLLDGVVGNTPLALRALANALEDQAENLKAPHRSLHHSSKSSSASKKQRLSAHPYLKPTSKKTSTSAAVATAVEESSSASDDHTLFFSPSPAQTLPTATSPSSTTTLFLPFSLNSATHTFPPSHYPSLSHLSSTHREAYQTHALRVERLIKAMEDKGVFLDGGVREEEVKDWEEEVLGVKVVFEGRSEEEVRVILGKQQGGEGEWWFLDEQERTSRDASVAAGSGSSSDSLVYPTIPLPLPIAINPNSIFASASNSLFEDQVLEERAEWSASSSPSLSDDASTSSLSSSSLSSSSSDGLGSSASFVSEFEQDEDLDDTDWLSEYSGGSGSASGASSSMLVLMEEQARTVEEEEEMGTDLFSSAYWSEMGGNGEELR